MPFTPGCFSLAALCAIAAPAWAPVVAAQTQRVTLSDGPMAAAPPTRSKRGFYTGDGQAFVAVRPDGALFIIARNGSRRTVQTTDVADATLLHLSRGHSPRPHMVWIGRAGIGFAALDMAERPVMLGLPGPGGAARAAAATRLAATESATGVPLILIGDRSGGVTALAVSDRYGKIRLQAAGHWSVGGTVEAISADGPRALIAAANGIWSLDLGAAGPEPLPDDLLERPGER